MKSIDSINFRKFTEKGSLSSIKNISHDYAKEEIKEDATEYLNEEEVEKDIAQEPKMDYYKLVEEAEENDISPTDKTSVKKVRENRKNLEKGLFGLRVDLRKAEEELNSVIQKHYEDFKYVKEDFEDFKLEIRDTLLIIKEEIHNRYTEFKAHINDVLLEYKESILIIQSYVDNQLVINKR